MTMYSGFSHWKWWFSIVMLVYQKVDVLILEGFEILCCFTSCCRCSTPCSCHTLSLCCHFVVAPRWMGMRLHPIRRNFSEISRWLAKPGMVHVGFGLVAANHFPISEMHQRSLERFTPCQPRLRSQLWLSIRVYWTLLDITTVQLCRVVAIQCHRLIKGNLHPQVMDSII